MACFGADFCPYINHAETFFEEKFQRDWVSFIVTVKVSLSEEKFQSGQITPSLLCIDIAGVRKSEFLFIGRD